MASPASPCIGICKLNRAGVCAGCGRSLGEIAEWPTAGDVRKREIVAQARARRRDLKRPEDRK